MLPWRISGSYLEACNCEAICPCRRIGGRPGGRSTYGECFGALSWIVEAGHAGDVQLTGMRAVLVMREPGPDQETVTCVIPGHDRVGRESFSDSIDINAGPLVFSVQGRCAYETTFEYSSDVS